MTAARIALLSALASATIASGWQWHGHETRRQEARRLRDENDRLRMMMVLTGERGTVDALTATAGSGGGGNLRADMERGTGKPTATTDYRNEGQATPVAAMQTLAWACDHGDIALMEKLLVFDPDAREKARRIFQAQRPGLPPQWTSLEAMAAALYVADGIERPYPVARVMAVARFEELRPGRVRLHLPGSNGDRYEFQQTAEGWKLAVTLAVVDDYLRQPAKRASKP